MLNVWNKYLWNKQTLNKSFSFQTYLLVTLLEKIKFCKENGKLFKTGKNSGCLVITWNLFCIQQPTTSGCDNQLVTKKLYSNTHQLLGNLAIESQVKCPNHPVGGNLYGGPERSNVMQLKKKHTSK